MLLVRGVVLGSFFTLPEHFKGSARLLHTRDWAEVQPGVPGLGESLSEGSQHPGGAASCCGVEMESEEGGDSVLLL